MFVLAVPPYKVEDQTSLATEGDRRIYSSKSSTLDDTFKVTSSSTVCNGHTFKSTLNNSPVLNCRGEFGLSLWGASQELLSKSWKLIVKNYTIENQTGFG